MSDKGDESNDRQSFSSLEMDDSTTDCDLELPPVLEPNFDSQPELDSQTSAYFATLVNPIKTTKAKVHTVFSEMESSKATASPQSNVSSASAPKKTNRVHNNTNAIETTSATQQQRVRLYNAKAKGPFTVWIREKNGDLTYPLRLSKYINVRYKSTINCVKKNGKMRVMLTNIQEANALVTDDTLSGEFSLNIPAEHVEVEGAIDWFELCDLDNVNELETAGIGKFNNAALQHCKIVHAERLAKRTQGSELSCTNTVKVVFEGQVLPNYVEIYGLRVRVRPFHQKPMFCDRCQQFGHTSRDCRRKQKCASCGKEHATANCVSHSNTCYFCQMDTQHGKNECPYFAEVTESYQLKLANRRKARYLQAIADVTPITRDQGQGSRSAPIHHPSINDTLQFPALNNRFSQLESNDSYPEPISNNNNPSTSGKDHRPKNPYAKVVREANRKHSQESPALKRRRTFPVPTNDVNPHTVSAKFNEPSPSASSVPQRGASQSPSADVYKSKLIVRMIMAFVRKSGISDTWIALIEIVIEPLLQAFMPQLPDLISALIPAVLNRTDG